MRLKFLLIPLIVLATSCTTAYKSGQTPDDVYYSPVRPENTNDEEKEEVRNMEYEEREIRMATRDRRWRDWDDDYNYRYDPYRYGYNYGYYYNPYYYYYPVYSKNYVVVNPKNSTPRTINLGSYNNTSTTVQSKTGTVTYIGGSPVYNNSNRTSTGTKGGVLRQVFTPSGSGGSSDNRTYSPSSSGRSSSSGNSSSGSSRPVSRPSRN